MEDLLFERGLDIRHDLSPTPFLEIISQIKHAPSSVNAKSTVSISPVEVQNTPGAISIQIDVLDKTKSAQSLKDALMKQGFPVKLIQKIPSAKMPKQAQVRYFYDEDKDRALVALAALKASDPAASLVKVHLPSPKG